MKNSLFNIFDLFSSIRYNNNNWIILKRILHYPQSSNIARQRSTQCTFLLLERNAFDKLGNITGNHLPPPQNIYLTAIPLRIRSARTGLSRGLPHKMAVYSSSRRKVLPNELALLQS